MLDRLRTSKNKIFIFLAILGPGIITATADNDGTGITTYSVAGAKFGYTLLWTLPLMFIFLAITQEIGVRIGAVTGKGLGGLIREKFGLKLAFIAMLAMLIANLGTTMGDFAGVAAAMGLFGVSKYVSIPIVAVFVYFLINKANYRKVRAVFLFSVLLYVVYIISGYLAHPSISTAVRDTFIPTVRFDKSYLVAFVAIVGTTVAPWGQFFIQSYVVDKRIGVEELNYSRADVIFGSFTTVLVAFFIIVACAATLNANHITINTAEQAARALTPFAGKFASLLFGIGLLNASVLAAAVLPLSSAYATSEAFGWEAGIDKTFSEAKNFYFIYIFFIVAGALTVMIPGIPLIPVLYLSQMLNGLLIPIILVFVLLIVNDSEIMGKYTNSKFLNIVAWAIIGMIIAISLLLLVSLFL